MEITSSLSLGPTPSPYEKALLDTVQKLDNTLNSLKLNHPGLTDKVENIKKYVDASLTAQQELDDYECANPYKVSKIKTGGASRKLMEFVTSERHAIGIYKRCVYEIERMDEAVDKLKAMTAQSKLNHMKQQLLNSYTKHYYRFKNDYGMLLRFNDLHGKLEKEFESSHDVRGKSEWRQDLEHWETPGYPRTPATYQHEYNIHL